MNSNDSVKLTQWKVGVSKDKLLLANRNITESSTNVSYITSEWCFWGTFLCVEINLGKKQGK